MASQSRTCPCGLYAKRFTPIIGVAMSRLLVRRIFVLLLAVFVTAGIGLSAVQASTMSFKMMDMAPGMGTSGSGSCDDCGGPGDPEGMAACVTAGSVAPVAAYLAFTDLTSVVVHRLSQDVALLGRDSGPDPYPPRTKYIG